MNQQVEKNCVVCGTSHNDVPVTRFVYKESEFYICPQHIPILIHDPQKLVGMIPDADKLNAG